MKVTISNIIIISKISSSESIISSLSSEELEASQSAGNAAAAVDMSGYHRDFYRTRSRSVDLSWISRSADGAANATQPPKM